MLCPALRPTLLAAALLLLPFASALAEAPYRMEGTVTDATTQQPIADAVVQVLIQSEYDPDRRVLRNVTDEQGRYSIELPIGHAWAWTVLPPAGYCPPDFTGTETFATTAEEPIFRKDYRLQKGRSLEIVAELPAGFALPAKVAVSLSQQREDQYIHGYSELNEQGRGMVTLPDLAGKFTIACGDASRTLQGPQEATVEFEEGFDPQTVAPEVQRDKSIVTVHDDAGRRARLSGCEARVREKRLAIVLPIKSAAAEDAVIVSGQVVDPDAAPIPGATVEVALHSGQGSALSGIKTRSDKQGRFSLTVPQINAAEQISLAVTHQGHASLDTKPIKLDQPAERRIDAGTIVLPAGCSIRIRAVDLDGKPLHGAIVEPLNGYASRTRIARTGADGECLLTDLASGFMTVSAQFGKLRAHTKVPLEAGENELAVIKLTSPPSATQPTPQPTKPPLAVGALAPEWTIAEWSDGKQRKLADYRGKVVVLDFWGTWCGPCIQMIPAMKKLQDRYRDREVVFLGVHTAGADMSLVRRLMKHEEWELTVGLDEGSDVATGSTIGSYAIRGFPSMMIVGRDGKIAFNSDVRDEDRAPQMRKFQALAKEAGLPWPLDKDATQEETLERMLQVHHLMLSKAIDQALEAPAK